MARLRETAALVITVLFLLSRGAIAAPIIDTSFGAAGLVRVGVPSGGEDTAVQSLIQPDGKVAVLGQTISRQSVAFVTRFMASGTPDPAFGDSGTRLITAPPDAFLIVPTSMALMLDGSFVVLSVVAFTSFSSAYALTRLTSDGRLDQSFGNAGTTIFDVGAGRITGTTDAPIALSPQPDGSILAVSGGSVMRFKRFLANGNPDASFGPDGVRIVSNLPPNFTFASARLGVPEPGGGITLVSRSTFFPGSYLVQRFTADARLDPTFNGIGYASGVDLGNPSDYPLALARGTNGQYALLGWNTFASSFVTDNVLWRFDGNGASIRTFGINGRLALGAPAAENRAIAVLPDGDVVIALQRPNETARIARFDLNGTLRASFGNNGALDASVPFYLAFNPVGIEVDTGGRLFVAGFGHTWVLLGTNKRGQDMLMLGLSPSGSRRTDFGSGNGIAVADIPALSIDTIDTLLINPAGRITTVGYTDAERSVAFLAKRILANGAVDDTFGTAGRLTPPMSMDYVGAARATSLSPDSFIVATGDSSDSGGFSPLTRTLRVTAGAVDPMFNPVVTAAGRASTMGVAARPDGRVLYLVEDPARTAGATSYVLQQVLPDGAPDVSFGLGGRVSIPSAEFQGAFAADIAMRVDGSSIIAIFTRGGGVLLYKLSTTGVIGATFGSAGSLSSGGTFETNASSNPRLLAMSDGTFVTALVTSRLVGFDTARTVSIRRFSSNGKPIALRTLDTISGSIGVVALPDASVVIGRTVTGSIATLTRLLPNDLFDQGFGGPAGTSIAFTTITALARTSSGELVVAGQDAASALVARYRLDTVVASVPVVEYFNINLRHYFDTASTAEMTSLDNGGAGPGWQRTGNDFRAWVPDSGVPVGAVPVCRFYGRPGRGPNSHFYTADQDECAAVKADAGWMYEGIAFYVMPPGNGRCVDSVPIYRSYNNGFAANDSNHRYSSDLGRLTVMQQQGWTFEGFVFCGGAVQ